MSALRIVREPVATYGYEKPQCDRGAESPWGTEPWDAMLTYVEGL
jgi:hypothetical protein